MRSLALLLVCGAVSTLATRAEAAVRVVTSIPPLAMIVAEIGGTHVSVRSILPPAADPHTFEPLPSDARAVSEADVVVSLGSSLDDWLGDAIAAPKSAATVLLDAPEAGEHDEHHDAGHAHGGEDDPHVWLDPIWVRDHALGPITRALCDADRDAAPQFIAASRTMTEQLTDLADDVAEMLARADTKTFLAWHPAWAHFAERFGLHALTAVGESEGREPSLHVMVATVRAARAAGIHAVLVEPQIDPRQPSVLAEELGVPLVRVDPIGDRSSLDRSTYANLIRFNAAAFRRALAVPKPEGERAEAKD